LIKEFRGKRTGKAMVYEDAASEEAVLRHQYCCTDVSLGADFYGVPLDFADSLFFVGTVDWLLFPGMIV
jgi:hypothetical protein